MRSWFLILLVLLALLGRTEAATVPPAFRQAMRGGICNSVKWSHVSEESWVARCEEADKTPGGRKLEIVSHEVFLLHHTPGASSFDKVSLFSWLSQQAPRGVDFDPGGDMTLKGTLLTVWSSDISGALKREVWNLASYPPRLIRYEYGGGAAWSHPNAASYPTCSIDMVRRRDICEWERPSCDKATESDEREWLGDTVRFREIPTLSFLSRTDLPADPFSCAAIFGDDPSDVYFGKNPNSTTFEAVADMDEAARPPDRKFVLYLRAKDRTPAASDRNGNWQGSDHWEVWLARAGNVDVNWRDDKLGYCAARKSDYVQLIVAPHKDGMIEVTNGTPRAKVSIVGASAHLGKAGELIVELTGELQRWATDGPLTVSYSDSLDGEHQNTLIGSSRVLWGKPETFGRVGRDSLCHAGRLVSPTTIPWP